MTIEEAIERFRGLNIGRESFSEEYGEEIFCDDAVRVDSKLGGLKMMTNKEKRNRDKLFELMRENPDLPVISTVRCRRFCDGFERCLGAWSGIGIDEYLITREDVVIKNRDKKYMLSVLEDVLSYQEFEALSGDEGKYRSIYDSLPWTKAIIVEIDLQYYTREQK